MFLFDPQDVHPFQVVNRYKGANYPIMNLQERVLSVLTNRVSYRMFRKVPHDRVGAQNPTATLF